jgi:hypothetical protein
MQDLVIWKKYRLNRHLTMVQRPFNDRSTTVQEFTISIKPNILAIISVGVIVGVFY